MNHKVNLQQGGAVAWIALIVAIVALALGWVAYNRTGENLEDIIEQEVNEAVEGIERDLGEIDQRIREEVDETDNTAVE